MDCVPTREGEEGWGKSENILSFLEFSGSEKKYVFLNKKYLKKSSERRKKMEKKSPEGRKKKGGVESVKPHIPWDADGPKRKKTNRQKAIVQKPRTAAHLSSKSGTFSKTEGNNSARATKASFRTAQRWNFHNFYKFEKKSSNYPDTVQFQDPIHVKIELLF